MHSFRIDKKSANHRRRNRRRRSRSRRRRREGRKDGKKVKEPLDGDVEGDGEEQELGEVFALFSNRKKSANRGRRDRRRRSRSRRRRREGRKDGRKKEEPLDGIVEGEGDRKKQELGEVFALFSNRKKSANCRWTRGRPLAHLPT